jgi:hypothetical protein
LYRTIAVRVDRSPSLDASGGPVAALGSISKRGQQGASGDKDDQEGQQPNSRIDGQHPYPTDHDRPDDRGKFPQQIAEAKNSAALYDGINR